MDPKPLCGTDSQSLPTLSALHLERENAIAPKGKQHFTHSSGPGPQHEASYVFFLVLGFLHLSFLFQSYFCKVVRIFTYQDQRQQDGGYANIWVVQSVRYI